VPDLVTLNRDDRHPATAVVTLNSPSNRNALSHAFLARLKAQLVEAARPQDVRSVLLRSSQSVFSSGADIVEALDHGMEKTSRAILSVMRTIIALPVPVVARIDGPVRAGGLGIVAACDVVVADRNATFAFSEARLGLAPAVVSAAVLPVMTRRSASLAFLTAKAFDGAAAEEWGLVTQAVASQKLDDAVSSVLDEAARCTRQGLRESKALLSAPLLLRIDELGDDLCGTSAELFASPEARGAMTALIRPHDA